MFALLMMDLLKMSGSGHLAQTMVAINCLGYTVKDAPEEREDIG